MFRGALDADCLCLKPSRRNLAGKLIIRAYLLHKDIKPLPQCPWVFFCCCIVSSVLRNKENINSPSSVVENNKHILEIIVNYIMIMIVKCQEIKSFDHSIT